MPFLVAEILNFQGSAHHVGVGSLSYLDETVYKLLKDVFTAFAVKHGFFFSF